MLDQQNWFFLYHYLHISPPFLFLLSSNRDPWEGRPPGYHGYRDWMPLWVHICTHADILLHIFLQIHLVPGKRQRVPNTKICSWGSKSLLFWGSFQAGMTHGYLEVIHLSIQRYVPTRCEDIYIIDITFVWGHREITGWSFWRGDDSGLRRENQFN